MTRMFEENTTPQIYATNVLVPSDPSPDFAGGPSPLVGLFRSRNDAKGKTLNTMCRRSASAIVVGAPHASNGATV